MPPKSPKRARLAPPARSRRRPWSREPPQPRPPEATPRGFKRKIAVLSRGSAEPEGGGAGAGGPRKRRWGATAPKKPSISISTDSLKSLIPEIRAGGGAELLEGGGDGPALMGEGPEAEGEGPDKGGVASSNSGPASGAGPPLPHPPSLLLPSPHLKICRTVTQVVPASVGENGRGEGQEEEEGEESDEGRGQDKPLPHSGQAPPTTATSMGGGGGAGTGPAPTPAAATPTSGEGEGKGGEAPPPPRRSQGAPWRPGALLLPVDEPVRAAPRPSPPRQRPSPIVHLCNLVRPFTLGQLKELLGRTGRLKDDGFWIDRIKSHCFVTYCSVEEAVATREGAARRQMAPVHPKVLAADFAQQEELDFHRGLLAPPPSSSPSPLQPRPSPPFPPSSSSSSSP
ncbi:apoptotic chromatin condensation inducer in the nucleus-like isoform X2 [Agelaius phoeniceus]|uniref:apoptotic chromatin condensation inducer in the nucleus-like isoform X2 n=1 Tax=Agelaius phoeniceus TaxID=39638 RepID=UPI004054A6CC